MLVCCALVVDACAENGSFSANGCHASWTETELTVGNTFFTRIMRFEGEVLKTVSLTTFGEEWVSDTARTLTTGEFLPVISVEKGRWSCIGEEGLRVQMAAGGKTNVLYVMPTVAGLVAERPACVDLAQFNPNRTANDRSLGAARIRSGREISVGADSIVLSPRHVRVTAYELFDRTDYTNELITEREWLLMMRELPQLIGSNVLTVEDTFTGKGLVFVRLAPLLDVRPVRIPDFVVSGRVNHLGSPAVVTPIANGWPIAEFAYEGGRVGRIAALQAFQRALRPYLPQRDGLFVSNTWGGGHGDSRICEEFLLKEIAAGAKLGVDVIQVDDGWQKGRSANSSDVGKKRAWGNFREIDPSFWEPCPVRLPNGLASIVRAAADKGLRFGLWFGPDSTNDAKHWEEDVSTVLDLFRNYGVQYFKIDSLTTVTRESLVKQRRFFDCLLESSDGALTFDLDVTCGERPGYFALPHIGPIFVENRYTEHGGYWPHQTLRSIWSLAHVIDPIRLRFEMLDPDQHPEKYSEDDQLRPKVYRADTLFAIVLCASPLGWMELSSLSPQRVGELKPLIARWKQERERLHGGVTWPIGARPDGHAWTGFVTAARDGGGYLLMFRELNAADSFVVDLKPYLSNPSDVEVIGGRGSVSVINGTAHLVVPQKRDYIWVKILK